MKPFLIGIGAGCITTVLPWSITGNPDLKYLAIMFAVMYFVVSMSKPGIVFVSGVFMFMGVLANVPSMATFGAITAMPFAIMLQDD